MIRNSVPDVATQTEVYGGILDAAAGKPVVFRTLDVGGDKLLPYWRGGNEHNPAMGWRAIRIGLDRPALLRRQLRPRSEERRVRTECVSTCTSRWQPSPQKNKTPNRNTPA